MENTKSENTQKTMKTHHRALSILGIIAVTVLSLGSLHAQFVSFSVGINSNGGIGVVNTSSAGFAITSVSITLTNDTFFDTTNTPPGTASSGWSTALNSGVATISLPADATTDGQQIALISFTGFDPADFVRMGFDLDTYASPDSSGNPTGAQILATFTGSHQATATLTATPATVAGASYSHTGSGSQAVPEPTAGLLVGLGLGIAALTRRKCFQN